MSVTSTLIEGEDLRRPRRSKTTLGNAPSTHDSDAWHQMIIEGGALSDVFFAAARTLARIRHQPSISFSAASILFNILSPNAVFAALLTNLMLALGDQPARGGREAGHLILPLLFVIITTTTFPLPPFSKLSTSRLKPGGIAIHVSADLLSIHVTHRRRQPPRPACCLVRLTAPGSQHQPP